MSNKVLAIAELDRVFEEIMDDFLKTGETSRNLDSEEVNATLFTAYCISKRNGNNVIFLDESFCSEDIEPVVTSLRRYGVYEFAVSPTCMGIIGNLGKFKEYGAEVAGRVYVKAYNGAPIPALLMKID